MSRDCHLQSALQRAQCIAFAEDNCRPQIGSTKNRMTLKLRQGQVWKHGKEFIRIVKLERLEVGYKVLKNLKTGEGTHQHTSKKDFCRLLKSCRLLTPKPGKSNPEDDSVFAG